MLHESDHRSLAKRLDLLHFQDEAPGMVFWHPKGLLLYRLLEDAVRRQFVRQGYAEVKTPQILRRSVWQASGHWEHFYDGMFRVQERAEEAALKPVSCPGHIGIAQHDSLSYRDLPLRYAEFGIVHRNEPGGTLHGLLRLRQFTQDDGHVFCTPDQALDEVEAFCRVVMPFYASFGFDKVSVAFSRRPEERAGDDASWDRAEAALSSVLDRLGWAYAEQPGAGAFYGPKLEFVLEDRLGRQWQCGTIQFDLVMPAGFGLKYVTSNGEREHAVMLHRALYGSLERFLGILLEHHGAALPPWLAPEQVRVLPVAPAYRSWAEEVLGAFERGGLRAVIDARTESLSRRVAEARYSAVPFLAVVGAAEQSARGVALGARDWKHSQSLEAAVRQLQELCRRPD